MGRSSSGKQTDPDKTVTDPDPTFGYTHNVNIEGTTDPTTFNLQDDGVETINDVLQGSYQLTEDATLPAGWEVAVNVNCSASSGVTVDTTAAPQIKFHHRLLLPTLWTARTTTDS